MDYPDNKKVVLLITTMNSFLAPFMGSSVFIGLPSIGKNFGMDVVMLSWVSLSYLLAAAMLFVIILAFSVEQKFYGLASLTPGTMRLTGQ